MSRVAWMDTARISAAFAVVVVHAAAPVAGEADPNRAGWWVANVYDAAVRWCVPVFVMVSGALLLSRSGEKHQSASSFALERVPRILVPLLAWAAIYLAWRHVRATAADVDPNYGDYLRDLAAGRPWYHLWYLYMILPLYPLVPFLQAALARRSRRDLLLLVAFCFGAAMLDAFADALYETQGPPLFFTWFLSYLGYFLAGYAIYRDGPRLGWLTPALAFVLSVAATALGTAILLEREGADSFYFYGYLSVTVVPMSLSVFLLFRSAFASGRIARIAGRAAPYALGIYLVHPLVLEYVQQGLALVEAGPIAAIPASAILAFILSLLTTMLLARLPVAKRIV